MPLVAVVVSLVAATMPFVAAASRAVGTTGAGTSGPLGTDTASPPTAQTDAPLETQSLKEVVSELNTGIWQGSDGTQLVSVWGSHVWE